MSININLSEKLNQLPRDIKHITIEMLEEIERGKKSQSQIEEFVLNEIRELIAED